MKRLAVGLAAVCCLGLVGPATAQFIPGGIDSVDITRIVPDTVAFYNGGPNAGLNPWTAEFPGAPANGNWEPYTSVLGNSAFLIECNTLKEGSTLQGDPQRFALAIQPTGGGAVLRGECFFGDNGLPYRGQINGSRQNGNPGRTAGDKRLGGLYLLGGGEASIGDYPDIFGAMPPGPDYFAGDRHGCAQSYLLASGTLLNAGVPTQVMASEAFDVLTGVTGTPLAVGEVSRYGGELNVLSNGNHLSVIDDKSKLLNTAQRAPTAIITKPDGTVVKAPFTLWPADKGSEGQIWSNVAAYKGGFVARINGMLRFYDNAGNFLSEVDEKTNMTDMQGNPWDFDRGRGDGCRLVGHVNSPYVFLAGRQGDLLTARVMVAAYDSRNPALGVVGRINVNELSAANGGTDPEDFLPSLDRVNAAVDGLNRVAVAYETVADPFMYSSFQTAVRVLNFNELTKKFTYLTKTFYPFVNYLVDWPTGSGGFVRTIRPSVSMTTREICVAAKGEINLENVPTEGSNTPGETDFYTVISHPDPKDDPTPRAYPSDFDGDGDVDLEDFTRFTQCFNGPNRPPGPAC